MIALLLMLAASTGQPAKAVGTATAHIVPGARIRLVEQRVEAPPAQLQRSRLVRIEDGQPRPLHLVEFQ